LTRPPSPSSNRSPAPDAARDALVRAVALVAVVGAAILLVKLIDVVLLIFSGVLLAVLLHAIARPLSDRLRMRRAAALTVALGIVTLGIGLLFWAFGSQIDAQMAALSRILPAAWKTLEAQLSLSPIGHLALDEIRAAQKSSGLITTLAPRVASGLLSATGALIVVMFSGAYFAFHPQTYIGGVLLLFPRRMRARTVEVLGTCQLALQRWLVGQLLSMILIGVSTGLGLWLIGVPSPIPLALMAGLGQFIPVVGPWLGAAPGLIIGYSMGQETFLWTLAVYLVTTQFEANFFTPYILRRMADTPMALTLFAVIGLGLLLGPLGVVLATPLAMVGYVLVRELYVEGMLGETLGPDPAADSG
jgi:predicted PurR-regulated permease PerM